MLAGYVALSPNERTNPSVCDGDVAGRFCFAAADDGLHQDADKNLPDGHSSYTKVNK